MALILDVTIESIDEATTRASWTGTIGFPACVFVHGIDPFGPLEFPGAARSADAPMAPTAAKADAGTIPQP